MDVASAFTDHKHRKRRRQMALAVHNSRAILMDCEQSSGQLTSGASSSLANCGPSSHLDCRLPTAANDCDSTLAMPQARNCCRNNRQQQHHHHHHHHHHRQCLLLSTSCNLGQQIATATATTTTTTKQTTSMMSRCKRMKTHCPSAIRPNKAPIKHFLSSITTKSCTKSLIFMSLLCFMVLIVSQRELAASANSNPTSSITNQLQQQPLQPAPSSSPSTPTSLGVGGSFLANSVIATNMAPMASFSVSTASSLTGAKARYKTMYACEDTMLFMDCEYGSKINLIRANYGRFSITQCNEQGQLDLSTDCMSPITFRIMRERCQDKQKCSVNATSSIFGDKCPKTRKYLEVHFQCQTDPRVLSGSVGGSSSSSNNNNNINGTNIASDPNAPDIVNVGQLPSSIQPNPIFSNHYSGGTSSILPPNNPTHQQTVPRTDDLSRMKPATASITSSIHQQQMQSQAQQNTVINSEIVTYNSAMSDSSRVGVYDQTNIDNHRPIIVTLRHFHIDNMSNPRCVLWDKAASQWTVKGSQVIDSNLTHTTCAFDQAASYLLIMDYMSPQTISTLIPKEVLNNPPVSPTLAPSMGSPYPDILEQNPMVIDSARQIQTSKPDGSSSGSSSSSSSLSIGDSKQGIDSATNAQSAAKFFSMFGYLLAIIFMAITVLTIAFIASNMRSSAGAALKSLGNFTAFGGPKYKAGRRADAIGGGIGTLHNNGNNKDLLVINNQNGHQFLYAPANATKISNSASTHTILTSGAIVANQAANTLHHQINGAALSQQMYSGNGTLSNMSETGAQSNNYYYGLMGFNTIFQQQQQMQLQQHQQQHHLSQHNLSAHNQALTSYQQQQQHHQANKSNVSSESANSSQSSSGVESGSASMQQHQQPSCLMTTSGNDYNLMGSHIMSIYGHGNGNLIHTSGINQQPTLTMNAHYSPSGGMPKMSMQQLQHQQAPRSMANGQSSIREHIYECVDEDKPYTARMLLPLNSSNEQQQQQQQHQVQGQIGTVFNSNTLSSSQGNNPSNVLASRTLAIPSRLHQQQAQNNSQTGKNLNTRLVSHPAIVRDQNQTKTSIICSKMATSQVTPQRATEISCSNSQGNNKQFAHDVMAIYNSSDTSTATTTTNATNSIGISGSLYGRNELVSMLGAGTKLSTDC